ncbi:nitrilase-related carbon-nitrogen hydrolase [Nocardioides sp. NPDC000441]|uniref:nitrilase-related carbon-nitrogen hydrolase n=1 Tax=Nocardioides sp. NPDC000441 TaxID=3154256 RepID=UPI00331C93B6
MTTWNSLRISLVQHASGLEPDANRSLLSELTPADSDLVVFPEVFARDFGKPGSDLSPYAEAQDGPFGTELSRVAEKRGATVVAGMLETSGDADGRPFNTLLVRGGAEAAYRKIHLYDSFGYKESDALVAGAIEPVVVDIGGVPTGLMTCYDLRFPEPANEARIHLNGALVSIPDAEAKAYGWSVFTGETDLPNYDILAAGRAFWTGPADLTAGYVDRYFAELPATAEKRSGWSLAEAAEAFFPSGSVTEETLAAARAVIELDLDPGVRRRVSDAADNLQRQLAIKVTYPA